MSKRRLPLGRIKTPSGHVLVKNAAIARTLEEQQDALARAHEALRRTQNELTETRERLAKLQNRTWVRIGEALRLVKP